MPDSLQQAYLDAMDIPVWNLRGSVSTRAGEVQGCTYLKLGPGSSRVLLICEADVDSAGRLANDINRTLGGTPVWAWPCEDDVGVNLGSAIEENLFTTVAIFGNALAGQLFDGELPAHLNTANLVSLPSMQEIQNQAEARRLLWARLCRSGMLEQG